MARKKLGLAAVTDVPTIGPAVILQRRGIWSVIKNAWLSYASGYQITVAGETNENEELMDGLLREIDEEAGEYWRRHIAEHQGELVEILRPEGQGRIIFGIRVPFALYLKLDPERISGGFCLKTAEDLGEILDLKTFSKEEGVCVRGVIAMFSDELMAAKMTLARFFG